MRITIPEKLGESVAIETKFGIRGDFDVRAGFEVLSSQTPTIGFGVGPELLVKPPGDWDKLASVSRFVNPKDTIYLGRLSCGRSTGRRSSRGTGRRR